MPSSTPADSRRETTDEVPDSLVAGAKALFGRQHDGELAVLTHDSLVDGNDPASDHRIRFEHHSLVVDLHVSTHATGSDLTGELLSTSAFRVELEHDEGGVNSRRDVADRRFAFEGAHHGIVRLRLAPLGDGPSIRTDWFQI
jgi:hypothetical protein